MNMNAGAAQSQTNEMRAEYMNDLARAVEVPERPVHHFEFVNGPCSSSCGKDLIRPGRVDLGSVVMTGLEATTSLDWVTCTACLRALARKAVAK